MEAALYRTSLPTCGVSSEPPFAIRYSPPCYMGLGIAEIHVNQGIQHVSELLVHYDKPTTSGKQMHLHFELAQLIIGSEKWIFDIQDRRCLPLLDMCWLHTTWKFILTHHLQIRAPHIKLTAPRENDINHNIPAPDLERLSKYRLYLQPLTLSDIVDASGHRVLQQYLDGKMSRNLNRPQDRTSTFQWPTQGKPIVRDRKLWENTIRTLFILPRSEFLQQP